MYTPVIIATMFSCATAIYRDKLSNDKVLIDTYISHVHTTDLIQGNITSVFVTSVVTGACMACTSDNASNARVIFLVFIYCIVHATGL